MFTPFEGNVTDIVVLEQVTFATSGLSELSRLPVCLDKLTVVISHPVGTNLMYQPGER